MNAAVNSGKTRRIPELDGLRGAAIFLVLVFHYITEDFDAKAGGVVAHLQRVVGLAGGAGVDLFFVLSGFLIGGILLEARTSPTYFKTFYARRFFRILPLYYTWIALYFVAAAFAGMIAQAHPHVAANLTLDFKPLTYVVFVQNLVMPHLPGLSLAWFACTWSLAVEEQFYLISPLMVRFLTRRRLCQVLIAIIAAAPVLRFYLLTKTQISAGLIYFMTPCRADALAVGMLTAVLWREPKFRAWLAAHTMQLYGLFSVLLVGFVTLWKSSPSYLTFSMETYGYSLTAVFFAVLLLITLSDSSGLIASAMRTRWLRELGAVSYCVYIIHLAVNVFCHAIILRENPQISTPAGIAVTTFAAALTFAIAKLSWTYFESPLLHLASAFRYEPAEVGPQISERPTLVPQALTASRS